MFRRRFCPHRASVLAAAGVMRSSSSSVTGSPITPEPLTDSPISADPTINGDMTKAVTKGDIQKLIRDLTDLKKDMATKTDLTDLKKDMATKNDLTDLKKDMATKNDLTDLKKDMATKNDLADMADEVLLAVSGSLVNNAIEKSVCHIRFAGGNATAFFFQRSPNDPLYLVSNFHVLRRFFVNPAPTLSFHPANVEQLPQPTTMFVTPNVKSMLDNIDAEKITDPQKKKDRKFKLGDSPKTEDDLAMVKVPSPLLDKIKDKVTPLKISTRPVHNGTKLWGLSLRPTKDKTSPQPVQPTPWSLTGEIRSISASEAELKLEANGTWGFSGTPLLDLWGGLVAVHVGAEKFPHTVALETQCNHDVSMESTDGAEKNIIKGIKAFAQNPQAPPKDAASNITSGIQELARNPVTRAVSAVKVLEKLEEVNV